MATTTTRRKLPDPPVTFEGGATGWLECERERLARDVECNANRARLFRFQARRRQTLIDELTEQAAALRRAIDERDALLARIRETAESLIAGRASYAELRKCLTDSTAGAEYLERTRRDALRADLFTEMARACGLILSGCLRLDSLDSALRKIVALHHALNPAAESTTGETLTRNRQGILPFFERMAQSLAG